jgi:hypothetical protein
MTRTDFLMWFIRIYAPLAGCLLLLVTVQSFIQPVKNLPRGFRKKALALELVQDTDEVSQILKVYKPEDIRRDLKFDTFAFIPLYVLLFLSLGFWFKGRELPAASAFALAIGICIVAAGLFDVLENLRQCAILENLDQSGVDRIRQAALAKWFLLFLTTAILSIPFLWRGNWVVMLGLLYLATAIVGCIGVFFESHRTLIEWGFSLLSVALLLTGEAIRSFAPRVT